MQQFVGRAEPLRAVTAGVSAALAGDGPVLVVSGEAGIGKTALVHEALRQLPDVTALWGGTLLDDWQPPFGPWAEIIRDAVTALGVEPARSAAGPGAALLAGLAPALDVAMHRSADSAQSSAQLLDSLGAVLLALAECGPVVVVVDDLQWAEPDAQLATRVLGRRLPQRGLALVATLREPDPDRPRGEHEQLVSTLTALSRRPGVTRVQLDGLDSAEIGELTGAFSDRPLPAGYAAVIREQTAGNPLYATEVIKHLVEQRTLELREGRWASDVATTELGLPRGLRDVVAQRLARLTLDARELLSVAAALGGDLTVALAQLLLDQPREHLLDVVDEVLAAGFLRPGTDGGYRFSHAVVRAVLAAVPNPDRAADLHLRVAHALERLHGADLGRVAGELAHQYFSADVADPGVVHCLTAADRAARAHAHEQVARYLGMAAGLTPAGDALARARLRGRQAVALAEAAALADPDRFTLVADAASAAADALAAANSAARGTDAPGTASIAAGRTTPDVAAAGAAPAADTSTTGAEQADLLGRVAELLKRGGAPARVWAPLVERGLRVAGEHHDLTWARLRLLTDPVTAEHVGRVHTGRWRGHDAAVLAVLAADGSELDLARSVEPWDWRDGAAVEELIGRAAAAQDRAAALRHLETAGRGLAFRLGDLRAAVLIYRRLLDVAETTGSILSRAEALGHLSICLALLGELDASARTQLEFTELTARLGAEHRLRGLALTTDTVAHYLRGTIPDRAATDALVDVVGSPAAGELPFGWVLAGFATLRLALHGDPALAVELAADAVTLYERAESRRYVLGGSLWVVGTALWECGPDQAGVPELADRVGVVIERLRVDGVPLGPLHSHGLCAGWMHALAGRLNRARTCWQQARADLARTGHRPFVAIAAYSEASAMARSAPASGQQAQVTALGEQARRGFDELGMANWSARQPAEPAPGPAPPVPAPPPPVLAPALPITPRERDVLALVVDGSTNHEIAAALHLSVGTVERHLANLYPKIGARNRAHAAAIALTAGITPRAR